MSLACTSRLAAAAVALLAAGACSDPTAPTIDYIDTDAAAAKIEPVLAVMQQPTLSAFVGLGDVGGLPASASAAPIAAVAQFTRAAAHGSWTGATPLLARSAARAAAADVLPEDVRGNTYVYNETTQAYEVATDRADAPANGIRVVLYAWDALWGRPSSPLTVIGHVDLIDESNASQNKLAVVLVRAADNATLLDYDITHSVTTSSESFSIAGSATNGTIPVTFNMSGTASETAATVTFDLAAPTVGFEVHAGVSLSALTGQATIETSLRYDGHTLSFRLTFHENGADGEIRFDNMRYATITIRVEETSTSVSTTTTFQKANGQPMSAQEIDAITSLFAKALELDAFWAGLLWPVGALAPTV